MNKDVRNYVLGVWAVGGAPLFFWAFVYFSLKIFLDQGSLPFNSPLGETIWFLVFGFCLISGVVALVALPFPYVWLRVVAAVLYLAAMPGLLFVMSLFAACANGDCL
jgi:hypothetical protein